VPPDLLTALTHLSTAALGSIGTLGAAYLSRRRLPEQGPPPRASSASLPAISLPAPRPRILVVDDERSFGRVIRGLLGHLDLEVDVAGSCAEARDLALRHPYRLLVVDLALPDGDGLALLAELRTRLAIYSGAGEDELAAARQAGVADAVVGKGPTVDALEAVVVELTGARERG
jgi:CheY-like chemotaxis protein